MIRRIIWLLAALAINFYRGEVLQIEWVGKFIMIVEINHKDSVVVIKELNTATYFEPFILYLIIPDTLMTSKSI